MNDPSTTAGLSRVPDVEGIDDLNGAGLFAADTDHGPIVTNVRRIAGTAKQPGSALIGVSSALLALLGAGCFYVSWWGQYLFVFSVKQETGPSYIEAGMLDAGMVILSGLALGLARQGKPAKVERVLVQLCSLGSAVMNYLAAPSGSVRDEVVFTAAPIFAAIITDRVVSVVRRHALKLKEESAWRSGGRAVVFLFRAAVTLSLYLLRLILDPKSTSKGLRAMVLAAAPMPGDAVTDTLPERIEYAPHGVITPHLTAGHDGQLSLCTACPAESEPVPMFATKKAAFEWHYRKHPAFGDRDQASQVAKEIAPTVGLQWGTARLYASEIHAADARAALSGSQEEIAS